MPMYQSRSHRHESTASQACAPCGRFFSDISSSLNLRPFVHCITCGPQWSQRLTPCQGFTGSGGMKRSTSAYGIPRKACVPSCSNPSMSPELIFTVNPSLVCPFEPMANAIIATITKILLFIIESIVLLICHKVTNNHPNSAQTYSDFYETKFRNMFNR